MQGQDIVSLKFQMRSQFEGERRVPTFVLAQWFTVDPHGGCCHRSFEVDEYMLTPGLRGQTEMPPIARNEFLAFFIKAVPGQPNVSMGNDDSFVGRIIEGLFLGTFRDRVGE